MQLFEQYGYYQEGLRSLTLKGKEGAERIETLLATFRHEPPTVVGKQRVVIREDYKASERVYVDTEKKKRFIYRSRTY